MSFGSRSLHAPLKSETMSLQKRSTVYRWFNDEMPLGGGGGVFFFLFLQTIGVVSPARLLIV